MAPGLGVRGSLPDPHTTHQPHVRRFALPLQCRGSPVVICKNPTTCSVLVLGLPQGRTTKIHRVREQLYATLLRGDGRKLVAQSCAGSAESGGFKLCGFGFLCATCLFRHLKQSISIFPLTPPPAEALRFLERDQCPSNQYVGGTGGTGVAASYSVAGTTAQ